MNKLNRFNKILEEGKKIFASEQKERLEIFKEDLFEYRLNQTEKKRMEIKRFFHSLKGAGASYGFNELSKLGKEYEEYVSNVNISDIDNEYFSKLFYAAAIINKHITILYNEFSPSQTKPENKINIQSIMEKYQTDNSEQHVLLIDDDKSIIYQLESLLNENGYKTISSSKPEEFIQLLKENKIDILLLDVMLPQINGLDFFKNLRDKNIFVPTILITSERDLSIKLKAYEIGAEDYITKPFDLNELVVRVNRVIKNSKNSKNMIFKDSITGAYNKALLQENLKTAKLRYLNHREPCSFCLIDIDSFSEINSIYDYDSGDLVLSEFSNELTHSLSKNTQIYRLNQDEFFILFPGMNEVDSYNLMKKINSEIKDKNFLIPNKGIAKIKFSGSITSLQNSREDLLEILERLNKDLSHVKNNLLSEVFYNTENKQKNPDTKNKQILIIDDMNSIIFLIKKHFEGLGYSVDYAINGKSGLEKIKALKPDIILLDIMLPEIDGFEILKKIKKDLIIKSKIIIMSSHSNKEFIKNCKDNGASAYIIKPISLNKLQETIMEI